MGRGWAKEHRRDTCNPTVHSGRGIGARSGLVAVQGGASSPASRANAIPAPTWLVFVTGMLCVILQSYSGSQIRTAVSRAEPPAMARRRGGATVRGTTCNGVKRNQGSGTARMLPPREADAGRRRRRAAAQRQNRGGAEVVDVSPPRRFPACRGRGRRLRARRCSWNRCEASA